MKKAFSCVIGALYTIPALALFGLSFLLPRFGDISIWQVVEYIGQSPKLLPPEVQRIVWLCYAGAALVFICIATLHWICNCRFKNRFGRKGVVAINVIFLVFLCELWYAAFLYADACFNLREEFKCLSKTSDLYAREFVACDPRSIPFDEKRNLVVFMGESIEKSFIDGVAVGQNLLPRLSAWGDRHDSFGEMISVHGCDHTICALFGIAYGSPRLHVDAVHQVVSFCDYPEVILPNAFRAWIDNGFNCRFVKGGELLFARTDKVFKAVPEVETHTYSHFCNDPDYLREPQKNPFGVNDEVVIEKHLRNETKELASKNKPFVLVVWTLNTHCGGWRSAFKKQRAEDVVVDSVMQADDIITDYLEWLEKQSFAENTEIFFSGDHFAHIGLKNITIENRRPINILVSKRVPHAGGNRTFAAFDLAPTLLELSGAKLPNGQFGLGTSLLSGKPTLLERIGREQYESEIRACGADYRRIAFGW